MTNRLSIGIGMAALLLAAGIAVTIWWLMSSGGTTTPLGTTGNGQRECDAASVGHFDASTVMTDGEYKTEQTFTVAGDDTRLVSHMYTLDGKTLVVKVEFLWKDGVQYVRGSTEAAPDTWQPWEIIAGDLSALRPPTPCLEQADSATRNTERHFVWKTEPFGDIIEKDEFWADAEGLPVRGRFTSNETATASDGTRTTTGDVVRQIDITYSGFGQTNTITAPIDSPATPEPIATFTPEPEPTITPTPTEETPANAGNPAVSDVTGTSVRVSWDRVRPSGTRLQDVRVNYRASGETSWTFGAYVETPTWSSRRQATTVSNLTCDFPYG